MTVPYILDKDKDEIPYPKQFILNCDIYEDCLHVAGDIQDNNEDSDSDRANDAPAAPTQYSRSGRRISRPQRFEAFVAYHHNTQ